MSVVDEKVKRLCAEVRAAELRDIERELMAGGLSAADARLTAERCMDAMTEFVMTGAWRVTQ